MKHSIRVLVCDDQPLFRRAVRAILQKEPLIRIVGEAANGKEAIDLVGRLNPNAVLMDVSMPQLDGCEATRCIKMAYSDVKVLILTQHDDEGTVVRCLEAGASGYLLKEFRPAELVRAIETVSNGEQYFSTRVLKHVVRWPPPSRDALSDRPMRAARTAARADRRRQGLSKRAS